MFADNLFLYRSIVRPMQQKNLQIIKGKANVDIRIRFLLVYIHNHYTQSSALNLLFAFAHAT